MSGRFSDRLKASRPDLVEHQLQNQAKATVAKRLRVLRDAHGLTQSEVAELVGISTAAIEQLEALSGPASNQELIDLVVTSLTRDRP